MLTGKACKHPSLTFRDPSPLRRGGGCWFTVALGGALLAVEQTWQLINRQHWPSWLFWLLIIVMLGASVLNTALRMIRDARAEGSGVQPASEASSP
jgi:hypothetical protein